MGFKSVYRTLQELFPQVDARILKATAIEHSKDPDNGAPFVVFWFILTEVMPHTVKQFDASSPDNGSPGSPECVRQRFSASASSSKHESTTAGDAANRSGDMKSSHLMDPAFFNETDLVPFDSTFYNAKEIDNELSGSKELTTSKAYAETGLKVVQDTSILPTFEETHNDDDYLESDKSGFGETSIQQRDEDLERPIVAHSTLSTSPIQEVAVSDLSLNEPSVHLYDDGPHSGDSNAAAVPTECRMNQPSFHTDSLCGSNYVELASLTVKDQTVESLDCSVQSDIESGMSTSKLEAPESSSIAYAAVKEDCQDSDNANNLESSVFPNIATPFGRVCNTDFIENIIEESKNLKKKLLMREMDSVLKLMREMKFQANVSEQANKEACRGGIKIHARVDELKSILYDGREAIDMHSGELYGERAILTAEMRELQSCLLTLSDIKEKSLSTLTGMQKDLESQLAVIDMERVAAEQEKYEGEESAQKALADQELIMEIVMQESKKLQEEAEENAKLRDFLINRGHVDMLQGEISVICRMSNYSRKNSTTVPLSANLCLQSRQFVSLHLQDLRRAQNLGKSLSILSCLHHLLSPHCLQWSKCL